jgi:hypothetical protein
LSLSCIGGAENREPDMIYAYNGFPDILVRAASLDEAARLIAAEVAMYNDDMVDADDIEEIQCDGPSEVVRVNTA